MLSTFHWHQHCCSCCSLTPWFNSPRRHQAVWGLCELSHQSTVVITVPLFTGRTRKPKTGLCWLHSRCAVVVSVSVETNLHKYHTRFKCFHLPHNWLNLSDSIQLLPVDYNTDGDGDVPKVRAVENYTVRLIGSESDKALSIWDMCFCSSLLWSKSKPTNLDQVATERVLKRSLDPNAWSSGFNQYVNNLSCFLAERWDFCQMFFHVIPKNNSYVTILD